MGEEEQADERKEKEDDQAKSKQTKLVRQRATAVAGDHFYNSDIRVLLSSDLISLFSSTCMLHRIYSACCDFMVMCLVSGNFV